MVSPAPPSCRCVMEIFCFLILGGSTEDIVVLDAAPPSRTAVLANGAVRMQSPFTTPTSCGDAACRQLAMPSPSGNARSSVRPPSRDRRSSVPPRARQIFTDPLIRNSTAYRLSTLSVAGGPRYSEAGEALSAFRISKVRAAIWLVEKAGEYFQGQDLASAGCVLYARDFTPWLDARISPPPFVLIPFLNRRVAHFRVTGIASSP